jgi:hypothetical protein
LCCMSFIDVRLLIAPLVSFAHCVVCPSLIYGFWLHLWYLLFIVLYILHWFTASDCTFGIFCPLCCLSFIDIRLLIAPLVSFSHCVVYSSLIYGFWLYLGYHLPIVLSILHWYTASDCTFGIFFPLCCLSFIDIRLLIAPLVSFVHCVVYSSLIYGFWLHLWYLLFIVLSILHWFTASGCTFGIFFPLCCMSFIDLRLLIASLVSFAHCVVCPSLMYGFWLHLWYLLFIVLYILHWFTASDCTFGIFWPLWCMSFIDLRLLIAPLVSSNFPVFLQVPFLLTIPYKATIKVRI